MVIWLFTPNTILKKGRTSEVILPREKRQVAKTAMRALQKWPITREEKEQENKFVFLKHLPNLWKDVLFYLAWVQRYFAFRGRQTATNLQMILHVLANVQILGNVQGDDEDDG